MGQSGKWGPLGDMSGDHIARKRRAWGMTLRPLAVAMALTVLAACQTTGTTALKTESTGGQAGAAGLDLGGNGIDQSLWRSGMEAERTHRYDQAAAIFANLYRRHASNPRVVAALMRNLRYNGEAQAAIEVAEYDVHLIKDAEVHFEYAKALLAGGRAPQALVVLEDVAARMPDDWRVFSAMGIAHDAQAQFSHAVASYQKALELSPNNAVVMNNLAMSLAMSGQLSAAIATLEEAAGYNRSNPHIRQNLALLYAVSGDEDKARTLAAMDLSASDLETNLSFYRRFGDPLP